MMHFQLTLPYGLVRDVDFTIAPGECILLAGPNGSGKTTLLNALAEAGTYVMIPTGIPKVKGFTLEAFVRTGCFRESNWAGKLQPETEERMQEALEQLGISHLAQRDLSTLSDGEFQKGCLAIGLVRRAHLLLLDEPTAFLDVDGRLAVLRTLADVARTTGTAILFSSHDLHDALRYCSRVLAFTPGALLASTPANREDVLRAAFPSLSL